MVGFLEAGRQAFESYKKDIVSAVLFGLANIVLALLNLIPIIGAFIAAYLFPRVLGWYYQKIIGNIKPNYELAFKIWLIYLLVSHIVLIFAFGSIIFKLISQAGVAALFGEGISSILAEMLLNVILVIVASFIMALILYYPLYASILGKINEFKIDIEKSAILFLYLLGWGILLSILIGIIGAIPFIGSIISLLLNVFFYIPVLNLIIAHKAISM